MTPELALFLREYRQERERIYHELGRWLTLDNLVFASVEVKPIDPCVLTHAFTFASIILLRGVKPKVISEALGHSSVAFTMDVYSHIIEGMQSDTMAPLEEVLPAGVSQKINASIL